MAAAKSENAALLIAIAKANGHPDPKAYAALVADIMAGKEPKEEEPTDV